MHKNTPYLHPMFDSRTELKFFVGFNMFNRANVTLSSDVDQNAYGKVTKRNIQKSQDVSPFLAGDYKAVSSVKTILQRHNNNL